jgi:hypothetical protein
LESAYALWEKTLGRARQVNWPIQGLVGQFLKLKTFSRAVFLAARCETFHFVDKPKLTVPYVFCGFGSAYLLLRA